MSLSNVEARLVAMEDILSELVAALGPCGDFDAKGNCRNHFATCPCPVGEADALLRQVRAEKLGSAGGEQEDAGTPLAERIDSAVDDALNFDPSLLIASVPSPPFDRARIARNWKAMADEIKRLRSEVARLQNA